MSVDPVQLDTLDWQQMVTAIQARIIPDSKGKWTLQAPVDPGVTLLELFAWMLDQRIYWMNQVPDALLQAILALLAVTPQAAQAAVTLLQISDTAIPPRSFPTAAAGTLLRLGDSNPPIIFTLDQAVTVLPIEGISLAVNGVDHTNDLAQGRLVPLLAPGQTSSEIKITLGLTTPLAAKASGQFFSIMLEFENPLDIYAQWSEEAVANVQPPATLTWSYTSTAAGGQTAFASAQVDDGTAGLRRSGVVRLPLPADWQAGPTGADPSITSYSVLLGIQKAAYTVVPQLAQVQVNVGFAHHSWQRSKQAVTTGWLPLPGNVISLPSLPPESLFQEFPPLEDTVQLQFKDASGNVVAWQRVQTTAFSGPSDSVFVVDRARSELTFGNGLTGRLPIVPKNTIVSVAYAAGGGTAGNVGANLSWNGVAGDSASPDPQLSATNLVPGDGGAETETLSAAWLRAQSAINDRNRAISKMDYEDLAESTPGVAFRRAWAAVGFHPDFPCNTVPGVVTVFVVPYAPRVQIDGMVAPDAFVAAPQPDPGALQAAQQRLNSGRLIGSEIYVVGPVYRPVWLALTVAVDSALSADLRQQILTGLQTFLDPLVGGSEEEGWPFGDPLRPSALLEVAQGIVGEAGTVQSVGVRIDGMAAAQSCGDVAINPYELVRLVHVDLQTLRRAPSSGGLR
jgi:predicted phage baseplate assembly protein